MRIRNTILSITMAAVLITGMTGCQTRGESAGLGAAIGAVAGAIIGNQSGSQSEGAVIGAIIGGVGGLIVDDIQRTKAKKQATAQETAVVYDYNPSQGESMVFENSELLPGNAVRGEFVTASMQYALLGSGPGKTVTETRVIKQGDEIVSQISSQQFTRNDGTWVSTQDFRVPKNWKPGEYTLEQTVATIQSTVSGTTKFWVE